MVVRNLNRWLNLNILDFIQRVIVLDDTFGTLKIVNFLMRPRYALIVENFLAIFISALLHVIISFIDSIGPKHFFTTNALFHINQFKLINRV